MLTPEYLLHISEGAEEIAEQLHQDILNRIIERIMARLDRGDNYILTAYDKWQLQVLQDAGFLLEDIQKEIARKTPLLQSEIAEAMEEAGVKSYKYDSDIYEAANIFSEPLEQSPHYIRMMQRNYEKTLGEMVNFTGTLANAAQQSFILGCDKAYNLVLSGSVGYTQAVKEVINDIVKDGVKVKYTRKNPVTGIEEVYHEDTIETATLRAVRTGVSQACADVTTARMDEYDWDIVLVSSHLGARVTDNEDFTNHYWWQGKFYSRSGKDKRFKPFSVCNEGHVQGICGANCRHSYMPSDGEFNPFEQFDSEENKKAYETEQRQRLLERRIRKTKREVMGLKTARDNATSDAAKAEFDLEYQRKAALLQKQNAAYNDYCEQNGLKKLRDRIDVARWDRKQAAAARGAAKKWNKRIEKTKQRGIINERELAMSLRQPPARILNSDEIDSLLMDAQDIGIDKSVLRFNKGNRTGFVDERNLINVRGDVLPDPNGITARDRMSQKAVLAHEYYGHYMNYPSPYPIGDWRDEFKASYDAAIKTPNLSDEERRDLMIDAYDRAKEAGEFNGYDATARRIIYGY